VRREEERKEEERREIRCEKERSAPRGGEKKQIKARQSKERKILLRQILHIKHDTTNSTTHRK
jgi:hypothetical protein